MRASRGGEARARATIQGETGTGKELVANAIHQLSTRDRVRLTTVNCGTLTRELLLSELFGHERGAFTGAVARKRGLLAVADGGTVFLDEIGDLRSTPRSCFSASCRAGRCARSDPLRRAR